MHNWSAGEEVTAAKLNQLNPEADSRISQAEHNILELYLENYFASKNTPFQGLFFDGFSDTNKAHAGSGVLTASSAAGQAVVPLVSQPQLDTFAVGDTVQVYDGTHQELGVVQSKGNATITAFSESNLSSFTYSENDGSNEYSDAGVVSGRRRINMSFLGTSGGGFHQIQKVISGLSIGATYSITFRMYSLPGSPYEHYHYDWDYLFVILDSTQIFQSGEHGGTPATGRDDQTNGQLVTVNFTATATSHTIKLKWGSQYTNIPMQYMEYWGFTLTQTAPALTLASNLAYTYAAGSNVKASSANIDTSNKRLGMASGVGDLKRVIYQSVDCVFTQLMASSYLWIMRKVTAKFHPNSSVAQSATQATVTGPSGTFTIGDTVDIYNANKTIRERKSVSNVSEANGGGNVVYDTTTGVNTTSTVFTYAHNVANQPNRYLVVFVDANSSAPTGATYNGVAMTKVAEQNVGATGRNTSIWVLANPATGNNNVVVTFGSSHDANIRSYSLYNASGVGTPYTTDYSVNNNYNPTLTGMTGGIILDFLRIWGDPGGNIVANNGQTRDFGSAGGTDLKTYHNTVPGSIISSYNWPSSSGHYAASICVLPTIPDITLTFSPVIQKSGGFTTADWVERVDVLPKISITGNTDPRILVIPTFQNAMDVKVDTEIYTEDEYTYTPTTPKETVRVYLEMTRNDASLSPYAKRLGVSLNT